MKKQSNISRMLLAFTVLLGWKAQAQMLELSPDQLKETQWPREAVTRLLDTEIILLGQSGKLCFDIGQAPQKAGNDQELAAYVELLRQMTAGSAVIENCEHGMMPMGSQDVRAIK